jgi:DUF1365 family protein
VNSALYFGRVSHTRAFPRRHRLSYGVWYLLADLDELDDLDNGPLGLTVNRPGAVSFRTADHGARDGSPLRPWIEGYLAQAGVELDGGAIRLLCFPRVLGYVFNPISVWFCHHRDGSLRALLYEVSNTFGERHSYLFPVDGVSAGELVRRTFDKELFVSPFIDMAARYDFTTRVPDDRVTITVRETVAEGQVLTAVLDAERAPITTRTLARAFFGYPLLTAKVIGGIHLEAIRLWRKGAPYRRRGAPPAHPVTILAPAGATSGVA